jgi:hypothetical protein
MAGFNWDLICVVASSTLPAGPHSDRTVPHENSRSNGGLPRHRPVYPRTAFGGDTMRSDRTPSTPPRRPALPATPASVHAPPA